VKDHAALSIAITAQIKFVRGPRVVERVVNMRDRRAELQFADACTEPLRGGDE